MRHAHEKHWSLRYRQPPAPTPSCAAVRAPRLRRCAQLASVSGDSLRLPLSSVTLGARRGVAWMQHLPSRMSLTRLPVSRFCALHRCARLTSLSLALSPLTPFRYGRCAAIHARAPTSCATTPDRTALSVLPPARPHMGEAHRARHTGRWHMYMYMYMYVGGAASPGQRQRPSAVRRPPPPFLRRRAARGTR